VFLAILSPAKFEGPGARRCVGRMSRGLHSLRRDAGCRGIRSSGAEDRPGVPGTILLIGTLDTKGEEYAFVRDRISERGHTCSWTSGILADPPFTPDVARGRVARAGGASLAGCANGRPWEARSTR
jgi:hypothetical protein